MERYATGLYPAAAGLGCRLGSIKANVGAAIDVAGKSAVAANRLQPVGDRGTGQLDQCGTDGGECSFVAGSPSASSFPADSNSAQLP